MAKSIKLRNPITKEPFYPITLIKNVYSNDGTQTLLNGLYPIGSIYISTNSKSPADIFGGSWEQIPDRFLLGAGGNYSAGSTGGEATHTLTIEEMPKHRHNAKQVHSNSTYASATTINATPTTEDAKGYDKHTTYAGGGQAHNNMPPYLAVYMWKRIG